MGTVLRWVVVVGWMSAMFAWSSLLSLHGSSAHAPDVILRYLAHIGEYAVLTVLLWCSVQRYTSNRVRAWLGAALVAVLYVLLDDWHQAWLVGHDDSVRTVGMNVLGIAASYALARRQPSPWTHPPGLCPTCHARRVYRSRRRGRLEWCSRLIGLAPYRCDICSHRFWHVTRRPR